MLVWTEGLVSNPPRCALVLTDANMCEKISHEKIFLMRSLHGPHGHILVCVESSMESEVILSSLLFPLPLILLHRHLPFFCSSSSSSLFKFATQPDMASDIDE